MDAKTFKATAHGSVYECASCLFGFVYPRPTAEETAPFYELDTYYTQGSSHMVNVRESSFLSRLRTHLAWRVDEGTTLSEVIGTELPPESSIVDIGCGEGLLLKELSRRGYRMTGIERDTTSVSSRDPQMEVLEGSAEALPAVLVLGSYDGVVFSHVIEHLVDPIAALRSACALLKPTGKLFCEVPNNEATIAGQSGLSWEHLDIPRHVNFFTERSLLELAQRAGLRVERSYFSGYCRYFGDSYIATEQRIHDRLAALHGGAAPSVRNSQARAWNLLARTAFAEPTNKYDSVGIVAGTLSCN